MLRKNKCHEPLVLNNFTSRNQELFLEHFSCQTDPLANKKRFQWYSNDLYASDRGNTTGEEKQEDHY